MFCQLLLVGYKEIYWILPKHHISWCPVTKQHHWNLFFDQHMSSFLCSKFQSTNKQIFTHWFIYLLIHLKCLSTSWGRILSMLLRSSQWYVLFHGSSEEEAPILCEAIWKDFREDLKYLCIYLQKKTNLFWF